jgi:hypothetical protein
LCRPFGPFRQGGQSNRGSLSHGSHYVSPSGFSSQERDSKAEQAHTLRAWLSGPTIPYLASHGSSGPTGPYMVSDGSQAQQAHTWSAMVLRPNRPIHGQRWFLGPTGRQYGCRGDEVPRLMSHLRSLRPDGPTVWMPGRRSLPVDEPPKRSIPRPQFFCSRIGKFYRVGFLHRVRSSRERPLRIQLNDCFCFVSLLVFDGE